MLPHPTVLECGNWKFQRNSYKTYHALLLLSAGVDLDVDRMTNVDGQPVDFHDAE
jgi:hypothetical protein